MNTTVKKISPYPYNFPKLQFKILKKDSKLFLQQIQSPRIYTNKVVNVVCNPIYESLKSKVALSWGTCSDIALLWITTKSNRVANTFYIFRLEWYLLQDPWVIYVCYCRKNVSLRCTCSINEMRRNNVDEGASEINTINRCSKLWCR